MTRADALDERRHIGREQTHWTRADALDESRRIRREQTHWTRADALNESRCKIVSITFYKINKINKRTVNDQLTTNINYDLYLLLHGLLLN